MVTYHNTSQLFGFQYVPLEEMDEALFGNKRIGPMVFQACVSMLEAITTEVVKCFPEQVNSFRNLSLAYAELRCRV